MPSFAFSKLIPGGNATILLPDPEFSPEQLPDISARLMGSMHLRPNRWALCTDLGVPRPPCPA